MAEDYREATGRIFDVQRFSTHDGPGIRTIVFLKGCPLRCQWCCNPEGQEWPVQQMTVGGKTKVTGRDVTVDEVLAEVLRDRVYYRRSGGGITLSGGECFAQPAFAQALLRASKEAGITTAVETTLCYPFGNIEPAIPYPDTVLLDIKHMDPVKHEKFTGKSNTLIHENARRLAGKVPSLIIRVPTIPGFNATEEEVLEIARVAGSLPGVHQIHLLAYHRLGQDKYSGLGREYALKGILPPTTAEMEALAAAAASTGLAVQIGG